MRKESLFKSNNRLVYLAGEMPAGIAEAVNSPKNMAEDDSDSLGQRVEERGMQNIDRASELSEGRAEKAREYCKTIEKSVKDQISIMDAAEQAVLKDDPRQNKPREGNSKEAQDRLAEWQKKVDEWNEKKAEYDNQILRLTITLARSFDGKDSKSKMVMDNTLKAEGITGGSAKIPMSAKLTPSVLAKKFYTNYKINDEAQGGWAVSEDLSDVPTYVEDGSLNFNAFKGRTDRVKTSFSTVATQAQALQTRYT